MNILERNDKHKIAPPSKVVKSPSTPVINAVDKDHWSYKHIIKWLLDKKFKLIGEGTYTATFGKPHLPYVVKVNKIQDLGALKYYQSLAKKESKYFPHIYMIRTYVSKSGTVLFIVIMEKLVPVGKWIKTNKLSEDAKGFIYWINEFSNLRDLSGVCSAGLPDEDDEIKKNIIKKWERKNPSVLSAINKLVKNSSEFAIKDLHRENVMIRPSTGDVVITDPLASY